MNATSNQTLEAENRQLQAELARHVQTEESLQRSIRELRAMVQELEQFAHVISHDLQAPLRSIAGFSQLLSRRHKEQLSGEALEFFGYIEQSVQQMQSLIQELLKLSRIGRSGLHLEERPLGDALFSALKRLGDKTEKAGASIEQGQLPIIRADHELLAQLLEQLIDNAIKFHRPGQAPRVTIHARREGEHWLLTVADNGIGIAEDQLENIFIVFRRLHGADDYAGTGIGLTICRKIAALHGGRIWASSDATGSQIHLQLPVQPAKPEPQQDVAVVDTH